jgi:DNA-binding MarR family transcriptional regulator
MNDYANLLIALRKITRAIDLQSQKLLKVSGLTISQLLVIKAIEKLERPTPSSVAREILLSQGTVTNLVDRMEKKGLLQRVKAQDDKRSVHLVITDEGKQRYADAPELLQAEFLNKYRKLESWEQSMLLGAMERVASMMDGGNIDASPILTSEEIRQNDL